MRMRTVGAMAAGIAALAGSAVAAGAVQWRRATRASLRRLDTVQWPASVATRYDRAELEGLPEPVVRYFDFALTPGQPLVRQARFAQQGEFAMRRGQWRRMRAVQTVRVHPAGFVWDAAIAMAPGIPVRVRDGYLGGSASMKAAIGGLVPVVDRTDTPGLAESALARWLAEAALVPTALLPSAGVRWTPLGPGAARATFTDAELTVSMDVAFGAEGEIAQITAERFRDVDGTGVRTPFVGHWWDYRRVEGMMLPARGEAAWILEDGPFSYWRARVDAPELQWGR